MWNFFNKKKIVIESDRDSVCMADDMSRHNVFTDFPENMKMNRLIPELLKINPIAKGWAVWAGNYGNYKCIKDRNGNWLINEKTSVKNFFKDIEKYIFFDKESFGSTRCSQ
jgi:hypothetical protein